MGLEIDNYTIKPSVSRSFATPATYADISPILWYIKALQDDANMIYNSYNNNPPTPSVQMNIYAVTSLGI